MKYIVYHGTNTDFDRFENEFTGQGNDQIGSGFYFTDNPDVAYGYGKNILKCEIEIDNPIRLSKNDYNLDDIDIDMSVEDVIKILLKCPNLKDEEESPLLDWMDVSDIEWDYVEEYLDGIAQTYVGRLISLEADFFKGYSTEFRQAVHDILGYDGVIQTFDDGNFYVCWFPEQIKILGKETITESEELNNSFWKWFENSKMMKNGKPIIFYHRTNAIFDTFDKDFGSPLLADGFYFSDKPLSEWYGKNIMKVYLKMENPYIIENMQNIDDVAKFVEDFDLLTDNIKTTLQNYSNEFRSNKNTAFDGKAALRRVIKWHLNDQTKYVTERLQKKKYDGLIIKNSDGQDGIKYDEYIVFKPNQIKAIDNKGTWSKHSDNIYENLNKQIERFL